MPGGGGEAFKLGKAGEDHLGVGCVVALNGNQEWNQRFWKVNGGECAGYAGVYLDVAIWALFFRDVFYN